MLSLVATEDEGAVVAGGLTDASTVALLLFSAELLLLVLLLLTASLFELLLQLLPLVLSKSIACVSFLSLHVGLVLSFSSFLGLRLLLLTGNDGGCQATGFSDDDEDDEHDDDDDGTFPAAAVDESASLALPLKLATKAAARAAAAALAGGTSSGFLWLPCCGTAGASPPAAAPAHCTAAPAPSVPASSLTCLRQLPSTCIARAFSMAGTAAAAAGSCSSVTTARAAADACLRKLGVAMARPCPPLLPALPLPPLLLVALLSLQLPLLSLQLVLLPSLPKLSCSWLLPGELSTSLALPREELLLSFLALPLLLLLLMHPLGVFSSPMDLSPPSTPTLPTTAPAAMPLLGMPP